MGVMLQAETSYLKMLPIMVIMGHGMGATMAPMTAAVMNSVGPQRAGLGSAMTNTSREVGGVFGIALLGTILTTKLKSTLAPAIAGLALSAPQRAAISSVAGHGTLDSSVLGSLGLTPAQGVGVQHAFGASFMSGFHVALVFGGLVLLLAAIVANRFIPSGAPVRDGHHPHAEAEPAFAEV